MKRPQPATGHRTAPSTPHIGGRGDSTHGRNRVRVQSSHAIGTFPFSSRKAFVFEKTLQPRNLVTESGLGCAASSTWWRSREMMPLPFFCAKPPQRMKTTS
eukprot:scaffold26885_cov112-Isochrysis_galbana.AAC.7